MFWWTVASLAAVSAGNSLRRRMNRMTAEVVVIDRYRLDTIVKLQTWYPAVSPTWLAGIVLRLAPAPDVECLLRVEGAEAYARKPEQYNAVQLTRQAARYDQLVARVPGAAVVDGQEAPEDVTEALRRLADAALNAR
jgi:thymidylate kinase